MKNVLIILIKISISLGLLIYLLSRVNFSQVVNLIRQSNGWLLLSCIFLYGFGQVLSTYKWSLLIHSHGQIHPFRNLVSYYYVGMFFNLFMPSIIGGDIQRCYAVYRDELNNTNSNPPQGRLTNIISSVMMERITGLFAMIWLAGFAYFFYSRNLTTGIGENQTLFQSVLPILLSILFGGTIIFPIILNFIKSNGELSSHQNMTSRLVNGLFKLALNFRIYVRNPVLFIKVILISMIFQSLMILLNIILGYSLGIHVPLTYYFIAVPLITLCTAIPISLSGFGVREGAYVYFFHQMSVDNTRAIMLSFSFILIVAINALIGGFILFKKGLGIEKRNYDKE